jgi:uncharacterized phage infection (PIP) family protein YhgE
MLRDMKVRDIAATISFLALSFLCIEGGLLLRSARLAIPGISKQLSDVANQALGTLTDYSRLAQDSIGVTGEIRRTLKASQESYSQTTANSAKATALLTDDLERFGNLIDTSNTTVGHLGASTDDVMARLQPILANLGHSSDDLATETPIILKSLANTSQNAADGTAQLVLTSQDIHATTHDIQAFVHRETTPVRGTWNVIKSFLVTFAGPMAQVTSAIK